MDILFYNRQTKKIEVEKQDKEGYICFLYETLFGRLLLFLIFARPWFSKISGWWYKSPFSKKDITPFIKKHNIEVTDNIKAFKSFNDFFIRKKKLAPITQEKDALIAPADSKLSCFQISEDLRLSIKHSVYDITDILDDKDLAKKFSDGLCLVFRLCVDDYHRYHFIDNGKIMFNKKVKGQLHTVRPISEKYRVFARNTREISIIQTENFGEIAYIEVGALLVGKINNHNKSIHNRFDEKGYFEFGGSTIILLLHKNIKIDDDILKANNEGYEVKISAGEVIGRLKEK